MNEKITETILEFVEFIKRAPLDEHRFPVFTAYTINILNMLKEETGFKNDIFEVEFDDNGLNTYEAMYNADGLLSSKHGNFKHKFIFNVSSDFFKRFYSTDVNVREKAINNFIFNVFHEFRHYMQNKAINTAVASKYNMDIFKTRAIEYNEYLQNHDLCFYELDADKFAIRKLKSILNIENRQYINIINTANFVEPFYANSSNKKHKIYDRNEYINRACDKDVSTLDASLIESTLLKYEYNKNGTPKTIVQLYNDMNNQISKITLMKMSEEEKKYAINSIKEMYYDILLDRLSSMKDSKFFNQIFELNPKNVRTLFEELLEYSKKVHSTNKKAIIERRKVRNQHEKNRIIYNARKMIKINSNYAMSVDDYFEKYNLENLDFLKPYVPECGFYYSYDGEMFSVLDFINEYVIPSGVSNKYEYNDLLIEHGIQPLAEVEYLIGIDGVNKKYYDICDKLNRFKRIYNENLYACFTSRYSRRTLRNMALVRDICNCVAFVENYDIKFLKSLIDAALKLTDDSVLNPDGENYYEIFMFELSKYDGIEVKL